MSDIKMILGNVVWRIHVKIICYWIKYNLQIKSSGKLKLEMFLQEKKTTENEGHFLVE